MGRPLEHKPPHSRADAGRLSDAYAPHDARAPTNAIATVTSVALPVLTCPPACPPAGVPMGKADRLDAGAHQPRHLHAGAQPGQEQHRLPQKVRLRTALLRALCFPSRNVLDRQPAKRARRARSPNPPPPNPNPTQLHACTPPHSPPLAAPPSLRWQCGMPGGAVAACSPLDSAAHPWFLACMPVPVRTLDLNLHTAAQALSGTPRHILPSLSIAGATSSPASSAASLR